MADYRVLDFDLSAAGNRTPVIAPGVAVSSIAVVRLTGGGPGNVFLRIGARGDPIPLMSQGVALELGEPELGGITFDNNGVPGAFVTFLVGQTVAVDAI